MLAERLDPRAVPRRHVGQRVVARELDPGALDPRVEPCDVDEARAMAVGTRREGADEVLLARLAREGDDLVLLDVGAEADHEVGEAGKGGVIHPVNA